MKGNFVCFGGRPPCLTLSFNATSPDSPCKKEGLYGFTIVFSLPSSASSLAFGPGLWIVGAGITPPLEYC